MHTCSCGLELGDFLTPTGHADTGSINETANGVLPRPRARRAGALGAGEGTRTPNHLFTSQTYVHPRRVRWAVSCKNVRADRVSSSDEDHLVRAVSPDFLPPPSRRFCSHYRGNRRPRPADMPAELGRHGPGSDLLPSQDAYCAGCPSQPARRRHRRQAREPRR